MEIQTIEIKKKYIYIKLKTKAIEKCLIIMAIITHKKKKTLFFTANWFEPLCEPLFAIIYAQLNYGNCFNL